MVQAPRPWRTQLLPLDPWLRGRKASEWLPMQLPENIVLRQRVKTPEAGKEAVAQGCRALDLPLPPEREAALETLDAWLGLARELPAKISLTLSSEAGADNPKTVQALAKRIEGPSRFDEWRWAGDYGEGWARPLLAIFAEWPYRPAFRLRLAPEDDPIPLVRTAVEHGFAGLWARLGEIPADRLVAVRCWLGARADREPIGRFNLVLSTAEHSHAGLKYAAADAASLGLTEITTTTDFPNPASATGGKLSLG